MRAEMYRREVLADLLFIPGLYLLNSFPPPPSFKKVEEKKEPELPPEKVLYLDVFDINSILILSRLDRTLTELLEKSAFLSSKDYILEALAATYFCHGQKVVEAGEKVTTAFGSSLETKSGRVSILEAFDIRQIRFDDLNNPIVDCAIDAQKIRDLIASNLAQGVVNMSFQVGDFWLYGDFNQAVPKDLRMQRQAPRKVVKVVKNDQGEREESRTYFNCLNQPISLETYTLIKQRVEAKIITPKEPQDTRVIFFDGYNGRNTYSNLKKMAQLAGSLPHLFFVVAGGNPVFFKKELIPDISRAKQFLSQQGLWPENIIVVGVREDHHRGPKLHSLGADVYLRASDLAELNIEACSSFAVPIISQVISCLRAQGLTQPEDLKRSLLEISDHQEIDNQRIHTFSFAKASQKLA